MQQPLGIRSTEALREPRVHVLQNRSAVRGPVPVARHAKSQITLQQHPRGLCRPAPESAENAAARHLQRGPPFCPQLRAPRFVLQKDISLRVRDERHIPVFSYMPDRRRAPFRRVERVKLHQKKPAFAERLHVAALQAVKQRAIRHHFHAEKKLYGQTFPRSRRF